MYPAEFDGRSHGKSPYPSFNGGGDLPYGVYTQSRGTITPFAGFDAEADCKKLQSAMKGLGKSALAHSSTIFPDGGTYFGKAD